MAITYASGTPYTLTETPAKVTFGTVSPRILIPSTTIRLVTARAMIDLSACTLSGPVTVTLRLRKVTGTPVNLALSKTMIVVGVIGTSGQNEADIPVSLPPVNVNNPTGASMAIELWADVSALPATGAIRIREASILHE